MEKRTLSKMPSAVSFGGKGIVSMAEEKSSKTDKKGRGLRHFAVRVCAIVKEKNATTYNEVGDELVEEEYSMSNVDVKLRSSREDDEKNIRRRVYDALNVLIAMDIIEKRKKEIFWRGLPSAEGDESVISKLKDEVAIRADLIAEKSLRLEELRAQQRALHRLSCRNALRQTEPSARIYIPFIVVRTDAATEIDVEVEDSQEAVCFTLNNKFEVEDEQSIFRRLGFFEEVDPPTEHEALPPHLSSIPSVHSPGTKCGASTYSPYEDRMRVPFPLQAVVAAQGTSDIDSNGR